MDKVSIIVSIYNQEKYLEECLDSVVDQNITEYQVILIDDGSTDRSGEMCQRYVRDYPFFQYIYQENSGLGSARNTGIRYAKGKYLLFLDSDDVLAANCLGTLIDYMDDHSLDILYVDEMICDEKLCGRNVCPTYPYMQAQITREQALEFCMQPSHICSRIYRKKLFLNIRFENMWYEDMACFPELLSISDRIGYFKAPVYYYRQHEGAITHRDEEPGNLDVIKAWSKGIGLQGLSERERVAIIKAIIKSIATFVFFKMRYAAEYLTWYQEMLVSGKAIHRENDMQEKAVKLPEDYPLIQQAQMVQDRLLVGRLEALSELYSGGGVYYFTKYDENREIPKMEHLSLIQETELELYSVKVNPKNAALYYANRELRKQNLISRNGEIKKYVLEKILVQSFMEFGYPIKIL